jgi:hypothetical protein
MIPVFNDYVNGPVAMARTRSPVNDGDSLKSGAKLLDQCVLFAHAWNNEPTACDVLHLT